MPPRFAHRTKKREARSGEHTRAPDHAARAADLALTKTLSPRLVPDCLWQRPPVCANDRPRPPSSVSFGVSCHQNRDGGSGGKRRARTRTLKAYFCHFLTAEIAKVCLNGPAAGPRPSYPRGAWHRAQRMETAPRVLLRRDKNQWRPAEGGAEAFDVSRNE